MFLSRRILLFAGLMLVVAALPALAQGPASHSVKHLTQRDGLASGKVSAILKDSKGFFWIGTDNGLNRYDGKSVSLVCISGNCRAHSEDIYVRQVFEDSKGNIWVASDKGLYRWRYGEQSVSKLPLGRSLNITTLTEDTDGNLWAGTELGVYVLHPGSKEFQRVESVAKAKLNMVTELMVDDVGTLWIGTWGHGVHRLLRSGDLVNVNKQLTGQADSLVADQCLAIVQGQDRTVWVGSFDTGLFRIDPDTYAHTFYTHEEDNDNSLNDNQVKTLSLDQRGYLWIGFEESGMDRLAPQEEKFDHFFGDFQGQSYYENYGIYSAYVDNQDQLWLGFRNDGLKVFPLFPPIFQDIEAGPVGESTTITGLSETRSRLWAGLRGALRAYDKSDWTFTTYPTPDKSTPLSMLSIDDRRMMVGTVSGNLFMFDPTTGRYTALLSPAEEEAAFVNDKVSTFHRLGNEVLISSKGGTYTYNLTTGDFSKVLSSWFHTIMEAQDGGLWMVGFSKTVAKYYPETGRLEKLDKSVRGDIKSAALANNVLYLGSDLGLYALNAETNDLTLLTTEEPYTNTLANATVLDNQGHLWYSSGTVIVRRDAQRQSFRTFDTHDGFAPIRFRDEVGLKLSDGRIAFGGNGGLTVLDPTKLDETKELQLAFTAVRVNGQPYSSTSLGVADLSNLSDMELDNDQSNLSVSFSLLSYKRPDRHRYQYRLSNLGNTWIDLGKENKVDIINLPTGRHTLHVRAADAAGTWSPEIALSLTVLPPLLLRWYFLVAYAVVVLLVIVVVFRSNSTRLRLEKEVALEHLRMENVQEKAEREGQFHTMRLSFFTNISHEFRTPLTLILAPLEKFVQKNIVPSQEHLTLMYKNAERLRRLINQVLDFRKMEAGELRFEPAMGDVVHFTHECWALFEPLATKSNLDYQFDSNVKAKAVWFDRDKFEKILVNLLSNAFKFTSQGKIAMTVRVTDSDQHTANVQIVVSDTGSGIDSENLPHIFDRFYHVSQKDQHVTGTGIGLALVKELVKLHNGTIVVESEPGSGTTFTLDLPLETTERTPEPGHGPDLHTEDVNLLLETTEESGQHQEETADQSLPTVLVVEDDSHLREYIRTEFRDRYNVLEAADGEEGLNQALKHVPDIVISDISMPVKNGFELSQQLKRDERTSHIPIILLTAHSSQVHQMKGFEAGIDQFISKPFSTDMLQVQVENLLKLRHDLQRRFSKEFKLEPTGLPKQSMDHAFLQKAKEVIERNLNNSEFSATMFAEEMFMSRVHLYRKMKALTNQSVSGFVKIVRLKLAADLIGNKKMSIKEAAYAVGFSDPKYFSKCFKQQFGVKPSEFTKEMLESELEDN